MSPWRVVYIKEKTAHIYCDVCVVEMSMEKCKLYRTAYEVRDLMSEYRNHGEIVVKAKYGIV